MFKAIIIGCGKIAGHYDSESEKQVYSHARAYYLNKRIEVVDYIDIILQKAEQLAQKYRSPNFGTDYIDSINRNKPDLVSICTSDHTHYEVVKAILENTIVPKIIFLEKPVCRNRYEFENINKLSVERNVIIIVNQTRRFDGRYGKIKSLIKEGDFGNFIRGDIYYYGGWQHIAVHIVDILIYLFDKEIILESIQDHNIHTYKDDPCLSALLSFKLNKKTKIYLHPFDENYYQVFDFDLKFDCSRIKIENFEEIFIFQKKMVNSMNENVLVENKMNLNGNLISPLETALEIFTEFLETKNYDLIFDYTLDKIENTMNIIWEGMKKYDTEYKR